jgi:UDP-N-acetylglucosamine--N-acetylmuramyl-(pentapeptide) pyrophosphoryl-undecaprenol N-acetylglucosamine transferase
MDKKLKVIVSGGGTGGHVFPAIAIANAIKNINPNAEFLFVGAKGRIEMEKVPKAGYPIEGLWISGFQRRLTWQNVLFPVKLISSLVKSFFVVNRFKPDVAVGVGGYASGPLLQMAAWKGIPTLIQEQNSYPGVTNQLLGKSVDRVCVVYDKLERYFPENKIVMTGNPVRSLIVELKGDRTEAITYFNLNPTKKTLFVTGGSLGAKGINEGIAEHLGKLVAQNVQVIWQTGDSYIDWAKKISQPYGDAVKATAFVDRMDLAYIAADAVVSRAGGTISELCIIGKPVILMPSPNVTEDHQTANAKALVDKNAALMVNDDEAKEKLLGAVQLVLFNDEKRQMLSDNIKKLAVTDAANQIAKEVLKLVR